MFSNRYIFLYSSIMVIIVAALLSSAAMLLQPLQEKNMTIADIQGILAAINVDATPGDAEALYREYVKTELAINQEGEVVSIYKNGIFEKGDIRPFEIDLKRELYNKKMGAPFVSPLFIAEIDGDSIYIIPLRGTGLWGPLYGNIALGPDFNTIIGADFSHDKETPGLGAEIALKAFSDQFIGKKIFAPDGSFMSVKVVKGGASILPQAEQIHGVDAISGGTITSNGVTDMLNNCLGNYISFSHNLK